MFTIKDLNLPEYEWLKKSKLYSTLDLEDSEGEIFLLKCTKDEKDINIFLEVINLWECKNTPFEFKQLLLLDNNISINKLNNLISLTHDDQYIFYKILCTSNDNLKLSVEYKDLEWVKYFISIGYQNNQKIFDEACLKGDLQILDYLYQLETENVLTINFINIIKSCNIDAFNYFKKKFNIFWPRHTFINTSIIYGNIECLKFLTENYNCIYNSETPVLTKNVNTFICTRSTLILCIHYNKLECIKHLLPYINNCIINALSKNIPLSDINKDNIECIKFLLNNGMVLLPIIFEKILQLNDINFIKYIFEYINTEPIKNTVITECNNHENNIECIKNGISVHSKIYIYTLEKNDIKYFEIYYLLGLNMGMYTNDIFLKIIKENKINFLNIIVSSQSIEFKNNEIYCELASSSGSLECLSVLHKNGYNLGKSCFEAFKNRNWECLSYLYNNGGECDEKIINDVKNEFERLKLLVNIF